MIDAAEEAGIRILWKNSRRSGFSPLCGVSA